MAIYFQSSAPAYEDGGLWIKQGTGELYYGTAGSWTNTAALQDWGGYGDQAFVSDTDTMLLRTAGGAGVEVPGAAVIAKRAGGVFDAGDRVEINAYAGAAGSPSELFDWPLSPLQIRTFGDYTLQTMLAFKLPGDPDSITDASVWTVRLKQTPSSTTSAGVKGLILSGPGFLSFQPSTRVFFGGLPASEGGSLEGSGTVAAAASGSGSYAFSSWHSADYTAFQFVRGSSQVGTITCGASGTSYNTTSDERLKQNIAPATGAAGVLDALQVRQFDWRETGDHQRFGFVAQELCTVFPEAVHTPDDGEQMMSIDVSKLVPVLVAEIQALKAQVRTLAARLA